ncbi:sporulation protein [Marinobacter vulgaris]|uniref:Sporulation protein n=1 Tax=Marinobacter vulgaris TaxID=1928331 RepID=A0A2V3ZV93_9GAMM|nr:SPOR domain-containing protein [Marinobacter vulgaris]PXX89337.1 sporulation protein [Marinobacter vulgaris]TSJ68100.1 sporulation protein [Marinobacter vulgaris]
MSRDYARKPKPASKSATPTKPAKPARKQKQPSKRPAAARAQQGGLSLRWILSLAAVGGFIGFIAYLNSLPAPDQRQESKTAPAQPPATEKQVPDTTASDEKPGFRFYDMLPDSEVIPPEVEEYTPGPASQQTFDYLVQTGSFRQQQDAERQRAEIAFQGLRAKVQRIDLDSGSIWYRVNVGPFSSRSQMNAAIDKLVNLNIQPLVRKIPKEG